MVNIDMLRGKIVEKRMSVEEIAKAVGVDKSTLYRRLNDGGASFTIGEADRIVSVLCLTADEASAIFFSQYVA